MAGKAADYGKTFMAGVLAKITDPDKRAQAEAVFSDPAAAEALVALGAGALAQSDINRTYAEIEEQKTALTADYEKLNTWYATRQADFEIVDSLKKAGKWSDKGPIGGDPNPPKPGEGAPPVDTSKFVSIEDFNKTMHKEQMAAAGFLALQQTIGLQHLQHFGEVIDTRDLLNDPNLGKQRPDGGVYGLQDAYNTKYAAQLTERSQRLEHERIEKLANDRVAEKMKGMPHLPIPLKGGQGSPLDLLEGNAEFKPDPNLAQTAAEEYARLQAART